MATQNFCSLLKESLADENKAPKLNNSVYGSIDKDKGLNVDKSEKNIIRNTEARNYCTSANKKKDGLENFGEASCKVGVSKTMQILTDFRKYKLDIEKK